MNEIMEYKIFEGAYKFIDKNNWEIVYKNMKAHHANVIAMGKDNDVHVIWIAAKDRDGSRYNHHDVDREVAETEFVAWLQEHCDMEEFRDITDIHFDKCDLTVISFDRAFLKYSHDYLAYEEN